jgi:diacylglycerol kinase (ATP)
MPDGLRAALIVNSRSGRGRAVAALAEVQSVLSSAGYLVTVLRTAGPGGAEALGAAVVESDAIVTLGGDGTISEVVNGVLSRGAWPDGTALVPLPLGTGNSFVRHFGAATGEWKRALDGLLGGRARRVDAGRVTWTENSRGRSRYFINVFGTGFMAQVAEVTNRRFKWLGGRGYVAGVFWELARLRAPSTRLTIEGPAAEGRVEPLTLVSVCNTQWTGEKMWIAPEAEPGDGLLDVVTVGQLTRAELVRVFPRIFDGTHVTHPAVRCCRATRVRIDPGIGGPLLIDGEVMGSTPVEIEVVPAAVRVAV